MGEDQGCSSVMGLNFYLEIQGRALQGSIMYHDPLANSDPQACLMDFEMSCQTCPCSAVCKSGFQTLGDYSNEKAL